MIARGRQREVSWAIAAAVVLMTMTTPASGEAKRPVPDATAQAQADQLIRDLYGKESEAARTSDAGHPAFGFRVIMTSGR